VAAHGRPCLPCCLPSKRWQLVATVLSLLKPFLRTRRVEPLPPVAPPLFHNCSIPTGQKTRALARAFERWSAAVLPRPPTASSTTQRRSPLSGLKWQSYTDDVDLIATIGKGVLVGQRLVGRQPPGPKTTCSRSPSSSTPSAASPASPTTPSATSTPNTSAQTNPAYADTRWSTLRGHGRVALASWLT
jgi:hypothetical protein